MRRCAVDSLAGCATAAWGRAPSWRMRSIHLPLVLVTIQGMAWPAAGADLAS